MGQHSDILNLALIMDIREKGFISNYAEVLDSLRGEGFEFEVIFLEASEQELLRRYSQTRRHHPLVGGGKSLLEGIRAEKEQLSPLRQMADKVINTSHYNVHELKGIVFGHVLKTVHTDKVEIHVLSFGFKYGIPYEADLVVDVRFLANPHFVPELRDLNGTSPEVEEYVKRGDQTRVFLKKYLDLLDFLIPLYHKEGKSYLTIAVGCTGGRHRSIVVAQEIYRYLENKVGCINLTHRDIELG